MRYVQFIGGVNDGKRQTVDDRWQGGDRIKIPVYEPFDIYQMKQGPTIRTEEYHLIRIGPNLLVAVLPEMLTKEY